MFFKKWLFKERKALQFLLISKRGVSLIEIMFAMGILALALVPILGVMQTGQNQGVKDESHVEATETAKRILTTLMKDVPFISLLPGGTSSFTNQALLDGYKSDSLNKAEDGGSKLISDHPATAKDETIYNVDFLHTDTQSSYVDDRGIRYIISVYVKVAPIRLQYFETNETSHCTGNKMSAAGGGWSWSSTYLVDETGEGDTEVFGDAPNLTGSASGAPYKWLKGDRKDARLKKIVVSIAYERRKGCINSQKFSINGSNGLSVISLVGYKSKLSD